MIELCLVAACGQPGEYHDRNELGTPKSSFGEQRAQDVDAGDVGGQVVPPKQYVHVRQNEEGGDSTGRRTQVFEMQMLPSLATAPLIGDVGEDGSAILPLTVDGTAGANTKQAALAFQMAAHLTKDAVVGPLTWRKLIEQDF